jgi:hypothetical protein
MTKHRDLEGPIHRAIVHYLRTVIPGNPIVHHSANEIGLSGVAIARQIAKNTFNGTVTGFPDLILICHAGVTFWEVKSEGGRLTQAQADLHAEMRRLGHRVAVVRSIEDVREYLDEWAIWRNDRGRE